MCLSVCIVPHLRPYVGLLLRVFAPFAVFLCVLRGKPFETALNRKGREGFAKTAKKTGFWTASFRTENVSRASPRIFFVRFAAFLCELRGKAVLNGTKPQRGRRTRKVRKAGPDRLLLSVLKYASGMECNEQKPFRL